MQTEQPRVCQGFQAVFRPQTLLIHLASLRGDLGLGQLFDLGAKLEQL